MLTTHFRMSASHEEYVQNLVGPDVVVSTGSGRMNKHAPAAVERLLCERSMLRQFACDLDGVRAPRLLDVYSNATRITDSRDLLGLNVGLAYLIPHIVPNDQYRQSAARRAGLDYLDIKFEELPPLREGEEPRYHGFNFTHALYYVPVETLVSMMISQQVQYAYATMHDFSHASASICCGTVHYHYGTDGLIHCAADGDDHVYVHPPCHWIFSNGVNVDVGGQPWKLTWCTFDKVGDTILRRFMLSPGSVERIPLYPDLDITDTADVEVSPLGRSLNFVTTMNKELKSPTLDLAYVPIVDAIFFYDLVGFTTQKGEFVPVPRGLVGMLRCNAAGQTRCPALYQLLLARAKNAVSQLNFPADMQARVAIFAAVTALVVDVEFETVALGTANRLFSRLFLKHGRVLDFEPVYLYTFRQLVMAGGLAGTTIIPAHYYGVDGLALTAGKTLTLAAIAHPFIAVPVAGIATWRVFSAWRTAVAHQSEAARAWLRFRENLAPGPVGRVIHFDSHPAFSGAFTPKTSPEAPLMPGAKLTVYGNPELNPPRALTRRGLILHGIAIQNKTPSYIPKTVDNAVQGLKARVLAACKYPDDIVPWSYLYAKLTRPDSVLSGFCTGELRNYNEGTFEHWVSRFPTQVQERLREARLSLVETPLSETDLKVQGIVKQEKTGTLDVSGDPPVTDARIVLSCSPRANAYLGPFHWSVANVYKKRFSVLPGKYLVWAGATTGEELGRWFDWAVESFSTPDQPAVFLFGDQSRFEKNQRKRSFLFDKLANRGCGATEEFLKWDERLKTVRGSMQGMPVSFKLDKPKRVSGGNDTSLGNFRINGAGLVHTLGEPGLDTYAVAIIGDDFLVVGYPDCIPQAEDCHVKMAQLGLDCDFVRTYHKHEVEFASNIPYPSSDGTVWGPKIGRVLHRFGWTLSSAPPDVYGAATSLVNTVNHIPFLRQFIDAHRRLSVESDQRYFKYKMLAEEPHEATAETYAFIAARYGLNAELETAFMERLREVTSLPCAIDWPLIDELVKRDE